MFSESSKVSESASDRCVDNLRPAGRILIDIADLGEVGQAVARHRSQGGAVIINATLHLDPPADGHVSVGARVVADHVVFVAPQDRDPQLEGKAGLCLATGGVRS